jgi:hypothetical protein
VLIVDWQQVAHLSGMALADLNPIEQVFAKLKALPWG